MPGCSASQNGRSKAALWAITRSVPASMSATRSGSIAWPATMSGVMPVRRVISGLIGTPGSRNAPNGIGHAQHDPVAVLEAQQAEFDHLVAAVIEAGRLDIHDHSDLNAKLPSKKKKRPVSCGSRRRSTRKAPLTSRLSIMEVRRQIECGDGVAGRIGVIVA